MADTPTAPLRPFSGMGLDLTPQLDALQRANTPPVDQRQVTPSPGSAQPQEGVAPGAFSAPPTTPFPTSFTKPGA